MITINSCVTEVKYPSVEAVTITPESVNLTPGSTQNFTASVIGKNKPPQTVTWSITGQNSPNTTISAIGVLHLVDNETSANITVIATSTFDKDESGNA